jgi:hypothetical protein
LQTTQTVTETNSLTLQFILAGFCGDCALINAKGLIAIADFKVSNKFTLVGGAVGICSDLTINGANITFSMTITD